MASSYEIDFVNLTRTCPGRFLPPFRTWRFHRKTESCLQNQTNDENQAFSIVNKSKLTFCDVLQATLQAHARICATWRLLGGRLRSFRTRLRHLLSFQDPIYWNIKKKCTTWLANHCDDESTTTTTNKMWLESNRAADSGFLHLNFNYF